LKATVIRPRHKPTSTVDGDALPTSDLGIVVASDPAHDNAVDGDVLADVTG